MPYRGHRVGAGRGSYRYVYHVSMYGQSIYFDISKARSKLGWVPRYSNNEMFVESYEWYLANRTAALARSDAASYHQAAVKQGALRILHWFL